MTKKIEKIILGFTLLICALNAGAQNEMYQVKIAHAKESGLHRLQLQVDWRAAMKADHGDLRVLDNSGAECPFVFRQTTEQINFNSFSEYKIRSQKHYNTYSELVIENPDKELISNLVFIVRNSDAHKFCAVEGSEDNQQWFSISAKQEIQLVSEMNSGSTVKSISIPASEYPFIRVHIEDWHSRPFLIKTVGHYQVESSNQQVLTFPLSFQEDPSKKKGQQQYNIFPNQKEVHNLSLHFTGPRLYKRSYRLFAGSTTQPSYQVAEGTFSSDETAVINLNDIRSSNLMLVIENGENPPLELKEVQASQLPAWIVFDADTNKLYELSFGDHKLTALSYDLENFVGSDISFLPVLSATSINKESLLAETKINEKPQAFYERKEFLWTCIILGAIVVLWFSRSLLKDLRKD